MKKIDIYNVLESKNSDFISKYPRLLIKVIIFVLNKILKVEKINNFLDKNGDKFGIDFLNSLFSELKFGYNIKMEDLKKIQMNGKVLIIANHPLGGLDGLAIVRMVYEIRKDVKIVVNDILMEIDNLAEFFLPFDLYSTQPQRKNLVNINKAFENENAVIFFPAGKVSRLTLKGIKDTKWHNGAIRFGLNNNAPILPIFIKSKNSLKFYLLSLLHNFMGTLLLPSELFNKTNAKLEFIIGDIIPNSAIKNLNIKPKALTKLLYLHLYNIAKGKKGLIQTEKRIIEPIDKKLIFKELENCELLINFNNNYNIYLLSPQSNRIINEIARLREHAFRSVGEGTGRDLDYDNWDEYYQHIILWDANEMEIVGSYRLGNTRQIIEKFGINGLYTSSLFDLNIDLHSDLADSLEVGRSFIQQKYWKSNALFYLWRGIGKYLQKYPEIKYLWGAVSISNSYSEYAKNLIIAYYSKWHKSKEIIAKPLIPYKLNHNYIIEIETFLNSDNKDDDFKIFKNTMKNLGFSIPILYKKYVDLCEIGGVKFIEWTINKSFNNAIDGLMIVDLSKLKPEYKEIFLQ